MEHRTQPERTEQPHDARDELAADGIVREYYEACLPERYLSPAADLTMSLVTSMGLYERYAKLHGLSLNALFVLMALRYSTELRTQKAISEALWIPKQTVGSIVGAFKKDGLVVEEPSPLDRRAKVLTLTDAGRARSSAVLDPLRAIESRAMQSMDLEGLESALRSMNGFARAFERGIGEFERGADEER